MTEACDHRLYDYTDADPQTGQQCTCDACRYMRAAGLAMCIRCGRVHRWQSSVGPTNEWAWIYSWVELDPEEQRALYALPNVGEAIFGDVASACLAKSWVRLEQVVESQVRPKVRIAE